MCGIIKVKSKLSKRESFKTGSWQSGDRKRWREEKKSAGFTLFLHSGRASKKQKKRKNVSFKRLSPKSVIPTYSKNLKKLIFAEKLNIIRPKTSFLCPNLVFRTWTPPPSQHTLYRT